MSNAGIIPAGSKSENNCHETPGNKTEGQLTDEINNCFEILRQTFSEIKSIIKNNKEAVSILPKPSQFDPNAPRVRVFVKSIRRKDVRINHQRERKMIDEDRVSIGNHDRDRLMIHEIRDIVRTIVKAVFRIIENNFDQLANRSSNTLGMRVKDSLILKVQQTYRKEIPLNELKTSLIIRRRSIVDDDPPTRFLPLIDYPARSSAGENLSSKPRKSVSLAEEVKIFNRIENKLFPENEVAYSNELMDTQNDKIMNREGNPGTEDEMYDFTSQKSSTSPVVGESSLFDKFDAVGTTEKSASFSRDQKIVMHQTAGKDNQGSQPRTSSKDLKKFDNPGEKPAILSYTHLVLDEDGISHKTRTSDCLARDRRQDVPNLSIAPSPNGNQFIVGLVETAIRENVRTQLIQQGEDRSIELSKTENEDDETSMYDKEQIEQDPTASRKRPSIPNVDIEIKHKEEQSTGRSAGESESEILPDTYENNVEDGSDENLSMIDVLNEDDAPRKNSSKKTTRSKRTRDNTKSSTETLDIVDKSASENGSVEKKRTGQIKKWMNEFVYKRKMSIRDKREDEDQPRLDSQPSQSFGNSSQQSATIIAVVTMDSASAKLDTSGPALESNKEDKISEKGILGLTVNGEELQNDEDILTPEAQFNFKILSDVVREISDHEISEKKERSGSLCKIKRVNKDESAGNENVRSSRDNGDRGLRKFLKNTFSTDKVGDEGLVKIRSPSLAQKRVDENKNFEEAVAIQDTNSEGRGNRTSTNEEERIKTCSVNYDTESDPEAESSCTEAVEKGQGTERNTPLAHKFPASSPECEGIDHEAIKSVENQEIGKNSEKKTSLFSRIIRSKNRTENNVPSEKTAVDDDTVIERKDSGSSEINDQIFPSSNPEGNSRTEVSENEINQKKNSDTLSKIEPQQLGETVLNDEKLVMKSSSDMKTRSTSNSPSSGKTPSRVSLKAKKLSKKSSRADSSADRESTNDAFLKESLPEVSQKVSQSSRKLSSTDISGVIIPGPNNPAAETLLVSSQGSSDPNPTDNFHVAKTSASENELKLTQRFKTHDKSESSLRKVQTQVYPVAADNILKLDLLSSAQIMFDDEVGKVEIKLNRSHWSLSSKKSAARTKSDKQEIGERESLGNDAKIFAEEPLGRQNSMLNVVSTFSREKDGAIGGDLQPENDLDITDSKSFKSFLKVKTSQPRNKSEDTLKALQLHAASVNTNVDQSDHPMKPPISSKKRNRFIEGLKRSIQSRKSASKRYEGKGETILKVSSESQTDMDEEFASESLTEFKDGNDIEPSLDNDWRSSAEITDDLFLDHKEEAGSVSLTDDEGSYPRQRSSIFQRLSERSTEKETKVGKIEDVIQNPVSEVSKQLGEEEPKNITEVYSIAVDSNPKQGHSSTRKVTDLSSNLDLSEDLVERKICNVAESDLEFIPNEIKLDLEASEDLARSKPEQMEKGNFSFKVNKSFARILQKMSLTNSSKRTSKCLDDDEIPKNEDITNESKNHREKKCSKNTISVRKESGKGMKTNEGNADNVEEDFSRKSEPIEYQIISGTESKSETGEATIRNSSLIFTEKSESLVVAYVVKPSVHNQPDGRAIIGNKVQSHANLIEDDTRKDKEKHGLLSNMKSIFKTSKKSKLQKRSVASIEDSENTDVINKFNESLHSLRTGLSETDDEKEQGVHFMGESVEIPTIQSMKSLQDSRKRTKNRRRSGHKLFDDKDTPCVTENIVEKSFQATVSSNFMPRQDKDKTLGFGIDGKANSSEESVAKSNLQMLLTDEEGVEEETVGVSSDRKKRSKKQQNPEGNTKKFAISLSRIFSNSFRKRKGEKETRPAADSQTNPEEHFEITRIPLTSLEDSTQRNEQKSEIIEDHREEFVAIKSLDSVRDPDNRSVNRESIVKWPSRVPESKCTTKISNDELLRPKQSGTIIFSSQIEANEIASEDELAEKDSIDNVRDMRKPSGKMYAAKGTIVSYAPMVERAKYISDQLDDRSSEDDQPEEREKRSSEKKIDAIRKLLSRASMRSRQDQAIIENRVDREDKKESLASVKSSIIRHRKNEDRSADQLSDENKDESKISAKGIKNENVEQESCTDIKRLLTRSRAKIRQPESTESPVVRNEVLLVNNVEISRVESANTQKGRNSIDVCEKYSKPAVRKSSEVDIAEIKVEPNHDGLMPTEIVERVVVEDVVIPTASQKDLNNTVDIEQKLSQRSSDTRKGSLLSAGKSYIKRRTEIEKEEVDGVNRCADKKRPDRESIRPSIEDLKITPKEQGVGKTESVFSRGLKKLFKKRSSAVESIASSNHGDDPADDLSSSLNVETLPRTSNDITDVIIGTETHEWGKSRMNRASDNIQFAVYHVNSKTRCPANYEENSQRLENESSAALGISETHIANGFQSQAYPESRTRTDQEKTLAEDQFQTKISSRDFKSNPSFASKRSTIVMMATPIPPRKESQAEDSNSSNHPRDESSNSPTAFYYLLGPSLDEALVDVRVVFQNLIDKITGRGR